MKKIYDSFLFFNELEILKLRMNILNDVVDYFVVVESTITFSSKPKQLLFQENKHLFDEFKDKIIHVIVDDTPTSFLEINYIKDCKTDYDILKNKILKYVDESPNWPREQFQWGIETYQRESIIKGLTGCNDNDIIIVSDVDEIPNPLEITNLKNSDINDVFEFKQNMFFYYINMLKQTDWSGPKSCSFKTLKNISLNSLRQNIHTTNIINNGGWHFSFMGGEEKIIEKIESYAHQEYNNPYIKNNIKDNIKNNMDPFFRGYLTKIDINLTYPKYILDNLEKYKHLIKV
jgi:beta-1,4-mannosyl-glycoprotein beta-1,4-N-acetylglucosaminyltransferase